MELFRSPPPSVLFTNPSAFVAAATSVASVFQQQSSPTSTLPVIPSPTDSFLCSGTASTSPVTSSSPPSLPLFLQFPSTSTTTSILMDTVLAAQKLNQQQQQQQNSLNFMVVKQELKQDPQQLQQMTIQPRNSPPTSIKMKSDWSSNFFQSPTSVGYPPMVPPPPTHSSSSFFAQRSPHHSPPQMSLHQPMPGLHSVIKSEPDRDRTSRSEQESAATTGGQIKGERCVGCGSESAIRVHYGASSCHGCKAFFRRSVFEGRVYMCSAENQCDITNESRNRCRACRLRNCLDGGMNPKHVREERSKIERMPGNTCTVSASNGVSHNQPSVTASLAVQFGGSASPPSSMAPSTSGGASNGFCPAKVESTTSSGSEAEVLDRKTLQEHQLTLFMVALEKQTEQLTDDDVKDNDYMGAWSRDISLTFGLQHPQMVIKRLPLMYTCERIMEASDLYLSWYRSFVYCADWAMGIPEFRVLPLADQTTLFKQNFMAFGWITFAYKCYQLEQHTVGIPLGNGAFIPYNDEEQKKLPERWALTYGVVCKKLIDLIVKVMIELRISEEEYCLIKTVSLFQQDCILSEPGAGICSKMRDRLLDALSTHIEKRFPFHTQSQRLTRALKISLMLPSFSHIGQVESTLIQQLTAADLHQLSGVPMEICAAQQSL